MTYASWPVFSTPLLRLLVLFDNPFNWCIAQGLKLALYDVTCVAPLKMGWLLTHQGWDMQGFLLMEGELSAHETSDG